VQWQPFAPVQSVSQDTTLYGDILNHCEGYKQYVEPGDKITSAHECTHKCNADVRNSHAMTGVQGTMDPRTVPGCSYPYVTKQGYMPAFVVPQPTHAVLYNEASRVNGFYVGNSCCVVIQEPPVRKSDAAPFIPENLRSMRYGTYITGQSAWDDSPLYLYDEWTAYLNGSKAAVQLKRAGNLGDLGGRIVDGAVEFVAYGIGVCQAATKAAPLDPLLRDYTYWMLSETEANYRVLNALFGPYKTQDDLWANLTSNQELCTWIARNIGYFFGGS
jgi:hypothetical protein